MIAELIYSETFAIKLGTVCYKLTPARYLVPSAQYAVFGLSSQYYYAWGTFCFPPSIHILIMTEIQTNVDGGSLAHSIDFVTGQKLNFLRTTCVLLVGSTGS